MTRRAAALLVAILPSACMAKATADYRAAATPPPAITPPSPSPSPPAEVCAPPDPLPGAPVPMRRLDRGHVEQTVRDVFGVTASLPVADERILTYRSNISSAVDGVAVEGYLHFAEDVTSRISLLRCTPERCAAWLFDEIAPRLFRRPLDDEQRARYQALFDAGVAQNGSITEGAEWVLEAMLQSPTFLYVDEPVDNGGRLDGYGIATRLALTFWGANPDPALLESARAGELDTPEGIRAAAKAMLEDPRSENGLFAFVVQWLELERLHQTDARPDLEALGPSILDALEREPVRVTQRAVTSGAGLGALLSLSETITTPELAPLYGAEIVSVSGGVTELDPARRAGILALPGVMASLAHAGVTSPTARGYAILANVMCRPPPPPPAGVNTTVPPVEPGSTTRERLSAHFSSPGCAACHRSMDGLGFAYEHFDPLGRWRDLDNGKPIDDRSDLMIGADAISVHGALDLATVLSARADIGECFARQWTRYATGVAETTGVTCLMKQLGSAAQSTTGGLEAMMVELAASDYMRKGNAP